ncbi:MAG: HEAT repeat domain-containing protein [bacterium]
MRDARAVEPLIDLIQDNDYNVRLYAVESLGKLKDPRAVEPLITVLNHKNADTRLRAIEALGEIEDPRAVEPLFELFSRCIEEGRCLLMKDIQKALTSITKESFGKNYELWQEWWEKNKQNFLKEELLELADIKEKEAIQQEKRLEEILLQGNMSDEVKIWIRDLSKGKYEDKVNAADKLMERKDPGTVAPLIFLLKRNNISARLAANILGEIKDPRAIHSLLEILKNPNSESHCAAIRALCEFDNPLIEESLIDIIKNKTEDNEVRGCVFTALRHSKKTISIDVLLSIIQDKEENPKIKEKAIQVLSDNKDPKAVKPLIHLLKSDSNRIVRMKAAGALGRLKDRRAVRPLIEALQDKEVAFSAILALEELGDPRAVTPLINLLETNPRYPPLAIRALGKLKDPRAVEPILAYVNHKDLSVRNEVAFALGEIGDERAVMALIAMADNTYNESSPIIALSKIKDIRAVEHFVRKLKEGNQNDRRTAVSALIEINDPRAVEPLLPLLKHHDDDIRRKTASILCNLKDIRAFDHFAHALHHDQDKRVRGHSVEYFIRIHDDRAIKLLIEALNDEIQEVRERAVGGLDFLKARSAVPLLITALSDPQHSAKKDVMKALTLICNQRFEDNPIEEWQNWWEQNKEQWPVSAQ